MKKLLTNTKFLFFAAAWAILVFLTSIPALCPTAVTSAGSPSSIYAETWLTPASAAAAEQNAGQARVYVTIANGTLLLSQEAITVTDSDNDGALTINDALFAAHESKYEGGAAAGYTAFQGEFGLALSKLWGVEKGNSYGYYVNNIAAMNLTDTIKDGDYINAYVFTDPENLSDTYCYFNENTAAIKKGDSLELTLSAAAFDAGWNPVTVPVADAVITINGEESQFVTDSNGQAVIALDKAGESVISAVSSTQTLVPPVCLVNVVSSGPSGGWIILIAIIALAAIAFIVVALRKKK